ncbi:heme-binding protein [Paracoccus yeei]|uniref:heme-binding protein n=1 Tax=Paracoccus yeei TaxID=147645 RepID=UPI00048CB85A|nr:heme-binding protein [Paracoccus yeei]
MARRFYEGPTDPQTGAHLTAGQPQYGSELDWAGVYVPQAAGDGLMSAQAALPVIRNLAFEPPRPDATLEDFAFTEDTLQALRARHPLFDATNPDLSAFEKAGGKLILWHGLADPHISPANTLSLHKAMIDQMGAEAVVTFVWPGRDLFSPSTFTDETRLQMSNTMTLTIPTLTLAGAEALMARAIDEATKRSARICVAVVDASGRLLAFSRMDGAGLVSIDVSMGKARTAAFLGKPASAFEKMIDGGKPSMLSVPGAVPLAGGQPVEVDGAMVGAIGISGSTGEGDEAIAHAVVQAFREGL